MAKFPNQYFVVLQSHFQKCFLLPVAVQKIHQNSPEDCQHTRQKKKNIANSICFAVCVTYNTRRQIALKCKCVFNCL